MLFRESQFKLMERFRLFLQSWVGYMRNSWDPRLYKTKEGLDFVRTSFPFFMFRSDSAGLFAKISAHSAGLSAAMWYWRKGRFGVGTRVTYWSCREFFVLGKNFFLCRCWYVHHCKTSKEKIVHAMNPLKQKTISSEFLHCRPKIRQEADISCTQLDRISLCGTAQWPEAFGKRGRHWGLNEGIVHVRQGIYHSWFFRFLLILILLRFS